MKKILIFVMQVGNYVIVYDDGELKEILGRFEGKVVWRIEVVQERGKRSIFQRDEKFFKVYCLKKKKKKDQVKEFLGQKFRKILSFYRICLYG